MTRSIAATRRLFAANIRRREERIDLALAALLVASEEYPGLSIEDYMERLDLLGASLAVEIDPDAEPHALARSIGAYMGQEQGYSGNRQEYYDPRNSYLNEVLDRRLGLPLTLGIVYMEAGRRAGVRLHPVSMPGHFLVKLERDEEEVYIDAFEGGRVVDAGGCEEIFRSIYGETAPYSESMLGAATKRQVITRLLQNLKSLYLDANDFHRSLRMVDLLILIAPWDLDQLRDRGLLRYRVGRRQEAIEDLRAYTQHGPPGPDVDSVREALRKIGSL